MTQVAKHMEVVIH